MNVEDLKQKIAQLEAQVQGLKHQVDAATATNATADNVATSVNQVIPAGSKLTYLFGCGLKSNTDRLWCCAATLDQEGQNKFWTVEKANGALTFNVYLILASAVTKYEKMLENNKFVPLELCELERITGLHSCPTTITHVEGGKVHGMYTTRHEICSLQTVHTSFHQATLPALETLVNKFQGLKVTVRWNFNIGVKDTEQYYSGTIEDLQAGDMIIRMNEISTCHLDTTKIIQVQVVDDRVFNVNCGKLFKVYRTYGTIITDSLHHEDKNSINRIDFLEKFEYYELNDKYRFLFENRKLLTIQKQWGDRIPLSVTAKVTFDVINNKGKLFPCLHGHIDARDPNLIIRDPLVKELDKLEGQLVDVVTQTQEYKGFKLIKRSKGSTGYELEKLGCLTSVFIDTHQIKSVCLHKPQPQLQPRENLKLGTLHTVDVVYTQPRLPELHGLVGKYPGLKVKVHIKDECMKKEWIGIRNICIYYVWVQDKCLSLKSIDDETQCLQVSFEVIVNVTIVDDRLFECVKNKNVLIETNKHREIKLVSCLSANKVESLDVAKFQYYEVDPKFKMLFEHRDTLIVDDGSHQYTGKIQFDTNAGVYNDCQGALKPYLRVLGQKHCHLVDPSLGVKIIDPLVQELKNLDGKIVDVVAKLNDEQIETYNGYKLTVTSQSITIPRETTLFAQFVLERTVDGLRFHSNLSSEQIQSICLHGVKTTHFAPIDDWVKEMYRSRGLVKMDLHAYTTNKINATGEQGNTWWHKFASNTPLAALKEWKQVVDKISTGDLPILSQVIGLPSDPKRMFETYDSECLYAIYVLVMILLKYEKTAKIGAEFKALWEDCFDELVINRAKNCVAHTICTVWMNVDVLLPIVARISDIQWLLRIVVCYPEYFQITPEVLQTYTQNHEEPARDVVVLLKRFSKANFSLYHGYIYRELDNFFDTVNEEMTHADPNSRRRVMKIIQRGLKLGLNEQTCRGWTKAFVELALDAKPESQLQLDAVWLFEKSVEGGNFYGSEEIMSLLNADTGSKLNAVLKEKIARLVSGN
jgi:hypothetical protein